MTTINRTDLIRAALVGELSFLLFAASFFVTSRDLVLSTPILSASIATSLLIAAPLGAIATLYIARFGIKYIASALQIMKFALVGVLNTLVDIGIFTILAALFGATTYAAAALVKVISFLAAVINSYLWNKFWVFDDTKTSKINLRELFSFMSVSVGGLIVNILAFSGGLFVLEALDILPYNFAQIVAALFASFTSLFWNFVGYKLIVFKK